MKMILENLAVELYNKGYKVAFWHNETYNEEWRKNDMTTIVVGMPGSSDILQVNHDRLGYEMVDFSKLYIPCHNHGSGAMVMGGRGTLEEVEKAISIPLKIKVRKYNDIDEWMEKSIFDFFEYLDPKIHRDKFIRKYILDNITHENMVDTWDDDRKIKMMLNIIHDTLGELWNTRGKSIAIEHYLRGCGHGFSIDFETYKQEKFLDKLGIAYSEGNSDKVFYKTIINYLINYGK